MKKLFLVLFVFLCFKSLFAQTDEQILAYIEKYKDIAVAEMKRTGVPAAITLAQGIHETTAGTSTLVLKSNNHFGIKCKAEWQGESVSHDDDAPQECFRKYNDPMDSYRDHSDFLKNRPYYTSLFKLDPTDYKGWAHGLKRAGYATNPRYPQILIKLIEEWDLQEFTYLAMGKEQEYYKDHAYLLQKEERVKPITIAEINKQASKQDQTSLASVKTDTDKIKAPELKKEEVKLIASVPAVKMEPVIEKKVQPKLNAMAEPQKEPEVKKEELVYEQPKSQYPAEEFQINKTRVIYAKKGTSLLSIANQYKLPLAWIVEFNDLEDENILEEDQLIYLQRKRKISDKQFHVVTETETLFGIAQSEGIRLESLLEMNLLENENMEPASGEKLYLNAKAPQRPLLASEIKKSVIVSQALAEKNSKVIKHIVQPKEGAYNIAKKYGVTIDDIKKWNNLQDINLKIGQEIIINKL